MNKHSATFLYLTAGIFTLAVIFFLNPNSAAAATNVSSCGVLDQDGETYILTQDISSAGTCIAIAGDDIVFNLNGKTITYGTAAGDNRYGIAMPVGYVTEVSQTWFPGLPDEAFGGARRATIYNGSIVQGGGNGANSHAIFARSGAGSTVHTITATVHGADTDNFQFLYANNLNIYNNTLINNSTVVTNRHSGRGVIESLNDSGNTKIYNNTITGGPQWGIRIYHNTSGVTGIEVYGNTISQNAYVSNPYAIGAQADNMLVYDNTITPSNGRGIHVTRNNIHVYNNTITVKEGPNAEYSGGWSHGIKLENATNAKVYGNEVTALAGGGYGAAYALDVTVNAGSNNEIYNNIFTATTSESGVDYTAAAAHLLGVASGNGLDIHHNTFRSNNYIVLVDWDNAQDVLFRSNTFEQTGSLVNFKTLRFAQGGDRFSSGFVFLDSTLGSGVSLTDPGWWPGNDGFSYSIEQYINTIVKDGSSNPVANATVIIKDKNGSTISTGQTNASGVYLMRVPSHYITGDPVSISTLTPHMVTVSATGYASASHNVTLDDSKTVNFTMSASSSSSSEETYSPPTNYTPPGAHNTEYQAPTSSDRNAIIVTPQEGGGPIVRIFDSSYTLVRQFLAFDGGFRGGIHAVSADLQGDGVEEIVVVPMGSAGPHVKVFDANGVELDSKFVTTLGYRSGFQITAADVDGDNKEEIILGTNRGGGPQVIIYDFDQGKLTYHKAFFAYAPTLRTGIQIAAADVDGDNVAEIVVAPNQGGGPHIRVFEHDGTVIGSFFAYPQGVRTGVTITTADVNKDGAAEVITVPNRGAPANVAVWTYQGNMLAGFYALPPRLRMGVTLQAGDIDDDGTVEIVTTPLAGGGPQVSIFNWRGQVEQRWFAYAPWDRFGMKANLIDLDADGDLEMLTVPGRGDGPLVKIFDFRGRQYKQFYSHGQGGFKGGVTITSAK